MTICDRINKDLTDLYNGGMTPGDIKDALNLHGLIEAKPGQTSFATRALPGYYVGDRKAKTVMVMLNPGMSVCDANCRLLFDLKQRSMINAADVVNYHKWCENYGHIDKSRLDNFDVKQAFFLHKWLDTDINFPENLCANPKSDKQTLLEAKEAVLTRKLQLELIPYASSSFRKFDRNKVHLVFPFLETILDEIFSQERKYVIFCSRLFDRVFEEYEKIHSGTIVFWETFSKEIPGSKITGTCIAIKIHHREKTIKAIIANTFPHQALPNAYKLMESYGDYCYECFSKIP
jgi:hypothetical protein